MSTPHGPLLAHNIISAQSLFERFLVNFDETNRTRPAPAMPNHLAWTLGHLALTAHRGAHRVRGHDDPQPLPESDFITGPAGNATRFGSEGVAFGSKPIDEPAHYPSLARSLEIMRRAHETLADALREATPEALARTTPWGKGQASVSDLSLRLAFHIGTHAGQIIDLRRGLRFEPVLG